MTTKERGDIAIGFAIAHFLAAGYEACLPIGDKRPYDLIIEQNKRLFRVQVKWAGIYQTGRCCAALRVMGGNQAFYSAKHYKKDDFDILFVHTERGENYAIPWKEIQPRSVLTVEDRKYRKYKV